MRSDSQDEFSQLVSQVCDPKGCKDRQMSDASTAVPWSSQKTPESDFDIDELNVFETSNIDTRGVDRAWTSDLEKELQAEISKAVMPAVKAAQTASRARSNNAPMSTRFTFLVPTLIGLIMYGLLRSVTFRIFMGTAVASLMLLPGIYIFVVDGCRPEDYNKEEIVNPKTNGLGLKPTLLLASMLLTLSFAIGISTSIVFHAFLGLLAALMFLPGIYLYAMDGCRPEGYDEDDIDTKTNGMLLVAGGFVGSVLGLCTCMVFRTFMGVVVALMLVPGVYLYVVDGCRPEGYDEDDLDTKTNGAGMLLIAGSFVGSVYGLYTCMVFRTFMGVVTTLMLVPGIYLYAVDGCRPEGYGKEDVDAKTSGAGMPLIAGGLAGSVYGLYTCMVFRTFMGFVAALMLLPGIYLYAVDDCRPEDYKEEASGSRTSAVGAPWAFCGFASLAFGIYFGMISLPCACMGVVAALMLAPGVYLYVVDGCRPEGYEESYVDTKRRWMMQRGMNSNVVDGCAAESQEQQLAAEKNAEVSLLLISSLTVGITYALYASVIFRVLMGNVAFAMLMPGIYLSVVDGSTPEDYEVE
jgi:hypothetical protein